MVLCPPMRNVTAVLTLRASATLSRGDRIAGAAGAVKVIVAELRPDTYVQVTSLPAKVSVDTLRSNVAPPRGRAMPLHVTRSSATNWTQRPWLDNLMASSVRFRGDAS